MAGTEAEITTAVLNVLQQAPDGLDANEVIAALEAMGEQVSPRGTRNLLNQLVAEDRVAKKKRRPDGPGAPTAVYVYKDFVSRQYSLFDDMEGVIDVTLITKSEAEQEELDPEQRKRVEAANTALGKIAQEHVYEEGYACAIANEAAKLASMNPVDMLVEMARWMVDDINLIADQALSAVKAGDTSTADKKSLDLAYRLDKAGAIFHRLWRLDPAPDPNDDIMHLPSNPRIAIIRGERAWINVAAAQDRLRERIQGDRLVEVRSVGSGPDAAAGTDASVADIQLEHSRGSFLPRNPVAVMSSAAALVIKDRALKLDYQDFDIFPDKMREYSSNQAAANGLVLSPSLRDDLAEDDFKHARLAAMDLRQYHQDSRVVLRQAEWRPVGNIPSLDVFPKPGVVFRDGRALPSVHRIRDFEHKGLYGRIVQSQIETFSNVVLLTQARPGNRVVYSAVVKNPNFNWLSALVFWYLHVNKIKQGGRLVVPDSEDVYHSPFPDTAVSHLLFLGLAKNEKDFSASKAYVTCRALRRFSDIADVGDDGPPFIDDNGQLRPVNENDINDWELFVEQRVDEVQRKGRRTALAADDYGPFIELCANVGVSMCYAAPVKAYEQLASAGMGEAPHFLLPRLENTVLINDFHKDKHTDTVLAWLANDGCMLDHAHTQTPFEADKEGGLPILVPDVIVLAHEAATFARSKMSEEVADEIRDKIADLRRWLARGR